MKLLTHNMLTSNIIKGVTKGFPLGINVSKVFKALEFFFFFFCCAQTNIAASVVTERIVGLQLTHRNIYTFFAHLFVHVEC